jgi:signal transduction histidine kinase
MGIMKKERRLKRYFTWALGIAAFIMIAAYSIFVEFSLLMGMEETATFDLKLISRDFAAEYKKNILAPLPQFPRLKAYIGEDDLPAWLKEDSPKNLETMKALIAEPSMEEWKNDHWSFHIVLPTRLHDGKRLYLIKTYTEKDDLPEAFVFSENLEILILSTGILFILLLMGGVRFLFRKVSFSLDDLFSWAAGLNSESLDRPKPEFKFKEIDLLADLIHKAVTDLHRALQREHSFLRHASHELRTPLAMLRSNMDLLERIKLDPDRQEKKIYNRIRRACDSMHQLTETLLWLSRKENRIPDPEPVDIRDLVTGLIQENRYLLEGKHVELILEIRPAGVMIPMTAFKIAVGNIIRNAFQYTVQGVVRIELLEDKLIIENKTCAGVGKNAADYGFGLGLKLVKQICSKLNLSYKSRNLQEGHQAILSWEKISR